MSNLAKQAAMLSVAAALLQEQGPEADYTDRPAEWVDEILGDKLWTKQAQILEAIPTHQVVAVASNNSAGKSFTASRAALWYLYNHPNSIVVTTAPTDRQVRRILWSEIRRAHNNALKPLGGRVLSRELQLGPGWFALGFTAPEYDPQKFQGFHAERLLVVVDEAGGVSDVIWEAVDSLLAGGRGCLLMIGNPIAPRGRFWKAFSDPTAARFEISAFDTPNFEGVTMEDLRTRTEWPEPEFIGLITPEWAARQLRLYGEDSPFFVSRVLGKFPTDDDQVIIPFGILRQCVDAEVSEDGPAELAVDVARSLTGDESVIVGRRGMKCWVQDNFRTKDTMEVVGRIKQAIAATGAERVRVDGLNMGAGVVDRLNELGVKVVFMNAAQNAQDKSRFVNSRAEQYWTLRELAMAGETCFPDDDLLMQELSNTRYAAHSDGRVKIEPKENIKKRIRRSPDRADSVAMAYAPVEDSSSPGMPIFAGGRDRWSVS